MRARSPYGGRHELGQNYLRHPMTVNKILTLVAGTTGPILEIGAGDGALTTGLARLGRDLLAVELDERQARRLGRKLPTVRVRPTDALTVAFDRPVIVGNIPFHLTTPVLRKLLSSPAWRNAVLLTQWEVARKRAGVGGGTMMTAQTAPWFMFTLQGRVPAHHFSPRPSVDGGILAIARRSTSLIPEPQRRSYEQFVQRIFHARGRGMGQVLAAAGCGSRSQIRDVLTSAGVERGALPRDLTPEQWSAMWRWSRRTAGAAPGP